MDSILGPLAGRTTAWIRTLFSSSSDGVPIHSSTGLASTVTLLHTLLASCRARVAAVHLPFDHPVTMRRYSSYILNVAWVTMMAVRMND